jgi:hypothetical protein
MVAGLDEHTPGCRFCQRLGRGNPRDAERPKLMEVVPGHWVETCPLCYGGGKDSNRGGTRA